MQSVLTRAPPSRHRNHDWATVMRRAFELDVLACPDCAGRLQLMERNVPVGRTAHGWESAELALFLASDKSDFLVGQVIPFAGGWVTTAG